MDELITEQQLEVLRDQATRKDPVSKMLKIALREIDALKEQISEQNDREKQAGDEAGGTMTPEGMDSLISAHSALQAENDRLREENERLRKALTVYAWPANRQRDNWLPDVEPMLLASDELKGT